MMKLFKISVLASLVATVSALDVSANQDEEERMLKGGQNKYHANTVEEARLC